MRTLLSALLVASTIEACTTHTYDPSVVTPGPDQVGASPGQAAPERGVFSLDPRFSAALERVKTVMHPLCDTRCGGVAMVATPGIDSAAHTRLSVPGHSLIEIRAETADEILAANATILLWVVAHEYGHHLDIQASSPPDNDEWGRELRAEALAGCALQRAGVSIDPVLESSRRSQEAAGSGAVLADQFGSDGPHPHWRHMRRAMLAGQAACSDGARSVDEVRASVVALTSEVTKERSPMLQTPRASRGGNPAGAFASESTTSPIHPFLP